MINGFLEGLSIGILSNPWLAPLMALLAGILTSFTPCSLSSVPLVIGFVGGTKQQDTKRSFQLSLTFALGMALTFTLLGVLASSLGKLMGTSSSLWFLFLGTLMVLMALQIFEVFNFVPSVFLSTSHVRKGFVGAFVAGILGGFFSSPCSTPVLIVLLGLVAKSGNILWGILLLLLYSLGHSFLVILAGTSVGFVAKITSNKTYDISAKVLKYALGVLILLLGFYMFYLGF